ncbi:hypothetical protein RHSIM_Rhsim05G0179000 [Rhododendron simsii]|uniref:CCHC-type domain-containing protein n=1 Tax=Rhododendron simsii TaxID=118357 RepID=A0A834H2H1_RHOSS|nr:hypothetical protein RHSIM_Rhsim05G0179000 [Rhododendron simsii]
MPPRQQRNVEDITLRDQIAESRQSNQSLQQMMNELLQRIPVTNQSTVQSEGSGRTIFDNEEEDDHSTSSASKTMAEPAFVNPWSMDRLACALENSDRSIQVHVPDFEGKLNTNEYCDWTESLEAFFDWRDLSDERKVQFVATKLKGHALIWWQQYQCSRVRKGVPKVSTWAEMKLKLDENFLPLDYAQTLYQKLHQLNQQSNQSVADYTEQFYQYLSRINLRESDDQLVASSRNVKDKAEKVAAPTFESPEAQGEGNKDPSKGISSSNKCFQCGEPGHRSYECPKKKAELNLMNEEEQEPTYDEEVFEKVQCEPDFDAQSLLIQQVLVAPMDRAEMIFDDEECCKAAAMVDWSKPPIYDEYPEDVGIALGELTSVLLVHNTQRSPTWVSNKRKSDDSNWTDEFVYEQRTKLFETYGVIHGFECLFIMDSGSQGNYVSQKLVSFLKLLIEYLSKPYHVSWVNQGSRIPVIKRCLVEFSIGSQYWDKIWCNVLPMESYDVLLGRPWQCDKDVNYQGRKNVYELKMNGNSIKLFPTLEKMKREKHCGKSYSIHTKKEEEGPDHVVAKKLQKLKHEFFSEERENNAGAK